MLTFIVFVSFQREIGRETRKKTKYSVNFLIQKSLDPKGSSMNDLC